MSYLEEQFLNLNEMEIIKNIKIENYEHFQEKPDAVFQETKVIFDPLIGSVANFGFQQNHNP